MSSISLSARPLTGWTLAVSVSESDDGTELGFPDSQVSRTVVRMLSTLLGQGAHVMLGHDWRDIGVMERVYSYIDRYELPSRDPSENAVVLNLLPWQESSRLTKSELRRLGNSIRIENAACPLIRSPRRSTKALRSLALTQLRLELTQRSDGRICIGGRMSGYQGRFPGVVEEAAMSVASRKPLYLVGLLGGATARLISTICGRGTPGDLIGKREVAHLQEACELTNVREQLLRHRQYRVDRLFAQLRRLGVDGLAAANGLTPSQNRKLFSTESLDEALSLVLAGTSRLKSRKGTAR
jgi:hypothetical protein